MEHSPIYRSTTQRSTASPLSWRGVASFACAGAALTISGIALGYQSLSETSMAEAPTPTRAGQAAVPVPITPVPVADRGHPDVISSLSTALIARVQSAPAAVQQLLVVGPLAAYLLPRPVADLPTLDLSINELIVMPAEDAVAESESELAVASDASEDGLEMAAPGTAYEPLSLANLALAAPEPVVELDETSAPEPEPVQVVVVETPRVEAPAPAPPAVGPAVQATPVPEAPRKRQPQDKKVQAPAPPPAEPEPEVTALQPVKQRRGPPRPDHSDERARQEEDGNEAVHAAIVEAIKNAERQQRAVQQAREHGDSDKHGNNDDKGGRKGDREDKGEKGGGDGGDKD